MDRVAQADRRALALGALGSAVLTIGGAFWALPHVEDELDEAALGVDSYTSEARYQVEWNGRDGYLAVPADTSRADAEIVAADLASLDGVRDVELVFAATPTNGPVDAEAPKTVESVIEPAPDADVDRVEARPANFEVSWADGSAEQIGDAPTTLLPELAALGVASPMSTDDVTVGGSVATDLGLLAPLVGTTLTSGRAVVVDGELTISGTAPAQADLDAATAALANVDAEIDLVIDPAAAAQDEVESLLLIGIEFETNTNVPTKETGLVIDDIADVLLEHPDLAIEIIGHTDGRGDAASNQALSESRALAVLEALIERGVDASRLNASGRGASEPIDSNATSEGQQNNRRVEIEFKENN